MNIIRIFFLLFIVSLAYADFDKKKEQLMDYYLSLDNNIKSYLKNDLEMIEKNKELIKRRIISVLARDMVYSTIYINEEFITNEEDVFNNEMFVIMSKIFKSELTDLNDRYDQNLEKLKTLDLILLELKEKFIKIEQEQKEYEEAMSKYANKQHFVQTSDRIKELIVTLTVDEESKFSTVNLDGISSPLSSYRLLQDKNKEYSLLEVLEDNNVSSILKGSVVFVENSNTAGYTVVLKHQTNLFSIYSNLSSVEDEIKIGSYLRASQTIGEVEEVLFFKFIHNNNTLDTTLFLESQ